MNGANGNRANNRTYRQSWKVAVYSIGWGLWLSGGLWLLFHYFVTSEGEFGPQKHPLEPWWLKFHGAFAFAAIWLFGLLWGKHVSKAWPYGKGRWSGAGVAGLLFWLMLTGYLLYYIAGENARSIVSVLHWGLGFVAPALLLWHRFDRGKKRK
jgi:hypothetical protein